MNPARGATRIGAAVGVALSTWAGGPAGAATEAELQSAIFRAKPAVVMVGVEATGAATVHCGAGEPVTVRPTPLTWIGSGSIIHPDGWIATNGHVVQPFHEDNEAALADELRDRAVAQGCGEALAGLTGAARAARMRDIADHRATRIAVEKRLVVTLSSGAMYAGEVKTYSPPAYIRVGTVRDAAGRPQDEFGKDVAIVKIAARDLPVVRLARWSTNLLLGQSLFVIGFPGVVVDHELLSGATRFEPSVTVGRVSGFRRDIGGQRVVQTDAAIIQGNSGGPVFDAQGEVIGAATFTSLQGDQVVQGFNFLIPVETIRDAATRAGVTPEGESAFTRLWNQGVDLYLRDRHARAYRHLSAAIEIHPGFPDVERVREDCALKYEQLGYLHRESVQWGLGGAGLLGAVAGVWLGGRRLAARWRRTLREMIRQELERLGVPRG